MESNTGFLPLEFLREMEELLGHKEFTEYLDSFKKERSHALRVNDAKLSPQAFIRRCRQKLTPVSWISNGFFYEEGWEAAKDPDYAAGLYYLQEASAMTPASLLPVSPGDRVLDLCAAPGGKATELGVKLKGEGLLFANDISNSRAMALLKNLELFGIPNICVSSESPRRLAKVLPEFFDKILVDAPCSGEGMFFREPAMVKDWKERGPAYYQPIQKEIVVQAVRMLKPGGFLLYSTCTFSKAEDEDVIASVLADAPEMELVPLSLFPGASDGFGLSGVLRLFPHKIRGEGHFIALLRKRERKVEEDAGDHAGGQKAKGEYGDKSNLNFNRNALKNPKAVDLKNLSEDFRLFLKKLPFAAEASRIRVLQDKVYYLPEDFPSWANLRYLRTGLLLGKLNHGRFEPGQALAMTLRADDFSPSITLSHEDLRVLRYRKGETIVLEDDEEEIRGWCLVCLEGGFPLGWAKGEGNRLKNKYYPGWRCG